MARRGKGDGSVYQRQDGRWVAEYNATLLDGSMKRRAIYGKTKREAQEKLIAALGEEQRGIHLEPTRETVGQFLDRWLTGSAAPSVKARTYESYQGHVKRYLRPALGKTRLVQLNAPQIQQMYTGLLARGLAAKTVKNIHTTLHRALKEALRWNLVARNVADAVTPPRVVPFRSVALEPEQAMALLGASDGSRFQAALRVALMTGVRQGELRALRWQDFDQHGAVLEINHTLYQRGKVWRLEEPKTAKSRRPVPLDEDTVALLAAWRERQQLERMVAGARWKENGLIFANTVGNPMHAGDLLMWLREMLAKAELPQMRWHDLRHAHATLLLKQGVHPKVVSERLGHATIGITMDLYSHVLPTMQRQAAGDLGRLLRQ